MTDGHFMLPDELANSIDHSLLEQKKPAPNKDWMMPVSGIT